jgi:hypothetical protein
VDGHDLVMQFCESPSLDDRGWFGYDFWVWIWIEIIEKGESGRGESWGDESWKGEGCRGEMFKKTRIIDKYKQRTK